jgi:hypothetical protein
MLKPNRTNLLLLGVLVVQIIVGVLITFSGTKPVESSRGPLLANFTPETVSKITITDGSDKTKKPLTLSKSGNDFVLSDFDNYPVDPSKVATLTAALRTLDTRRLIAQNKSSQNRLKVAPDTFDRQLAIRVGDKDLTLYLGTANEASAAYARLSDSDAIYLPTGLSVYDVSANAASWVNPAYLTLTADEIAQITVENSAGKFELVRDSGAWTVANLPLNAGEKVNAETISPLATQLASISLTAPIGTKADDKLGMAKPSAVITIKTKKPVPPTATPPPTSTSAGVPGFNPVASPIPLPTATPAFIEKTITLQIGAKLENGNYVFKSSESNYYVEIAPGVASPFVNLTRATVISVVPTATVTNTPFGPLAPPTSTPTVAVTVAATATHTPTTVPTTAPTVAPTDVPSTATALPSATPSATP